MFINAQKPEELRIAITSDSELEDFQIESAEQGMTRGNIYRGVVVNTQPSLSAAFIDYGAARHGFLPFHDVLPQAYHHKPKGDRRARVEEVLERGKPIVVQVTKDAEGQKGAGLTTNLSLAGRYLVLTPLDDNRGVSRKVEDDELRHKLRDQAAKLKVPPGGGFIVRTNALDQTKTSLNRDFNALMRLWKQIEKDATTGKGPKLLYTDQDLIIKSLRDYFDSSIDEVLIDNPEAFERAEAYLKSYMPRGKSKLTLYSDRVPLFAKFGLDPQIEHIFERTVSLPSGGSIVIDRTEALVAIDVNSGKFGRGGSQEDMALKTNVEAAEEVARQLRLRDIGGLIVVDFIDMRSAKNRSTVEKTLRDGMKSDKARSTVGRISPNGLLEINRQRIRQALHLRTHRACPTCDGTGRIASPDMVGLNLLRRIEAEATTRPIRKVRIALHPELADAFQNGRRREIAALEEELNLQVQVIAATSLHRPEQELEWFEHEGAPIPSRAAAPPPQKSEAAAAPPPRPQQQNDTDEGEVRKGRKRRRRRKRHGETPGGEAGSPQPSQQPVEALSAEDTAWDWDDEELQVIAAEAAAAEAEAPAETQVGPGAEAVVKKSRKRRPRRKRRAASAGTENGEMPESAESTLAPELHDEAIVPPQEEVPAAEAAPNAKAPPKKKPARRRSRKRTGESPAGKAASSSAGESERAEETAPAAFDAEAGGEEPAVASGSAPRKRRHRRRRRSGNGQKPAPETPAAEEGA